jgi:hypothetical protein
MCRLPLNLVASTSWNPQGLSRAVMGLLYLYLNCAYNYMYNCIFVRCWRRMEKISWTDYVRNKEVLLRVKEQRNILHEIRKRKANWIGHILCRNCLLQRVIEGKIQGGIEVTGRRGRWRWKLLDDLKEKERILTFEGGSSGLHYVESWLWKRLWTCRKTDYLNEFYIYHVQ